MCHYIFAGSARFIDDSAIVQPARLARGLRRVALERGVRIFERSMVTGLDRSRPAVVRTEHGAVKADQVVLTIGAWAAGWPGFRRSFGVIADHMVVTEPIPELLAEIGWTSQVGIADGRDLLFYLRPTDDHRIAIGGGGLGVFIFRGVSSLDTVQILAGAVPAALIALAADGGLGWVERKLSPA